MRRLLPPSTCLALLFALALPSLQGCDKKKSGASQPPDDGGAIGYDDASSPDMAAIGPALEDSDLAGVHARGMTLWRMQRGMRLGDKAFAGFVGVTAAKFVALASVDPGDKSGQVAFYRWLDEDLEDGAATPEEAQKWVVIPLNFDPDSTLDAQEQSGKVGGEELRTLAALMVVEAAIAKQHPDGRWVAYTFREQGPDKLRQTRIYMIGADEASPDIEYTVLDPEKRKQDPTITAQELQLEAGGTAKLPLTTPAPAVGPSTIMRAVAIATVTEKAVTIVDGSGNEWTVAPQTGDFARKE